MAIDTQRLKDVFEQWDLAALKDLYAEDFEQTEMDDVTPPNEPRKRTKQDLIEIVERNRARQQSEARGGQPICDRRPCRLHADLHAS